MGVVSWSLYATEPEINRYLLSYIDVIDVSARSPWRLVRRMSRPTVEWRQTLARFQTLRIPPIGPFDFYFGTLTPVRCAVYVICKGAPPTWFQLDFLCVRGTGGHSHAKLIRKGSERPQVSLA